eukprot:2989294-Pyramimonas_sp.AAC.1
MVSESKQTPAGLVYRTHRSLRQGRVQEDWSGHSLLDDGRGRRKTAFVVQTDKEETVVGVVAYLNFAKASNFVHGEGAFASKGGSSCTSGAVGDGPIRGPADGERGAVE